ncbi:MAG: hypothetical protein L3K18_08730 [Thermoplasmata archaeon]|nr:hypothetical protein [Thermoplasmata archaeon]MCI4357201.1 hypothetical protein [Thermoplasmata archaeon]
MARQAIEPVGRPGFTVRTPITLVAVAFYVVGAGATFFFATGGARPFALILGALMFAVLTAAWVVGYHLLVPRYLTAQASSIVFETRWGPRRKLAPSDYTFRLTRAGRFGSALSYVSKAAPKRGRGIFLTLEQTEYLVGSFPELRAGVPSAP